MRNLLASEVVVEEDSFELAFSSWEVAKSPMHAGVRAVLHGE